MERFEANISEFSAEELNNLVDIKKCSDRPWFHLVEPFTKQCKDRAEINNKLTDMIRHSIRNPHKIHTVPNFTLMRQLMEAFMDHIKFVRKILVTTNKINELAKGEEEGEEKKSVQFNLNFNLNLFESKELHIKHLYIPEDEVATKADSRCAIS